MLEKACNSLGKLLIVIPNSRGRLLISNFSHAFPSWHINRIRSAAEQSAAWMIEMGLFSLIYPAMNSHRRRHTLLVDQSCEALLRGLTKGGTPVLFLLPHVCLFESLAASPLFRPGKGKSIGAIYRPNRNLNLDNWIRRARLSSGIKIFSRKEGLKKAMYFLRNKNWLTILFDQNGGESGADTYFLDRVTSITTLPDIFRNTKELRVIYAKPKKISFFRSKLEMQEIFTSKQSSIALAAHELLARDIRSCPLGYPEWLWSHGKWKTHYYPKVRFNLNSKRSFLDKDDNSHTGTRILIRLPNWLGDVVMAMPIIRSLRKARSDMYFIVLGLPIFREVIESFELCEEYVSLEKSGVSEYISLLLKIRYKYPECQLLFTNSLRGDLESLLIGAPQRLGLEIENKARFGLTDSFKINSSEFNSTHLTKTWEKMIRNFGFDENVSFESFHNNLHPLSFNTAKDKKVIGISLGSSNNPAKQWSVEKWSELILLIQEKYNIDHFILLGVNIDTPNSEEIEKLCVAVKINNRVGKTNLLQLIEEFRKCFMVIGCDSGAVHLASAVGTPTLTVFGPTNSVVTGPCFNTHKINFQIDSIKDMSSVSPRSVLGCYHNLDLKIRSSMEEN